MKIVEAANKDMDVVRALFREYQQWLGIDLCFQGFEHELATLPGKYAPPRGVIFLAFEQHDLVGCVAVRVRTGDQAELKRLYVRPDFQGQGIGKKLFETAMQSARKMGYQSIVLDTLESMLTARAIYQSYGFREIDSYYDNPDPTTRYYQYDF